MKIVILLDRSGSMENVREMTVSAINDYLKGVEHIDATVTLHLFDGDGHMGTYLPGEFIPRRDRLRFDTVWRDRPVREVRLHYDDFRPRGSTPLHDATAKALMGIDSSGLVTFIVVTDGQENASSKFTGAAVREMIEAKRKLGWNVVYLGANQDAIVEGGKMGYDRGQTMTFDTHNIGATMQAASSNTAMYAATGEAAAFTETQRKAAVKKK